MNNLTTWEILISLFFKDISNYPIFVI